MRFTKELRVGVFVILMLSGLAYGIFLIGQQERLFVSKVPFKVRFRNVGGLSPGAPVMMSGVTIGSVENIQFPKDPDEQYLIVDIQVEEQVLSRIRQSTRAQIKRIGLLGDRFVSLYNELVGDQISLTPGSYIQSVEPIDIEEIGRKGEDIVGNVSEISETLRLLLQSLTEGKTVFSKLMSDPEYGERILDEIESAIMKLQGITTDLETQKGLLGRLISDPQLAQETVGQLSRTLKNMENVSAKLAEGKGALGALISDEAYREEFLENLSSTSRSLRLIAENLRQGEGLIPRLLKDEAYSEEILRNFQVLSSRLASIATKIDEGKGSLGAFLEDPSIYEGLRDIVHGTKESRMLRWFLNRQQKRGRELRKQQGNETKEEAG